MLHCSQWTIFPLMSKLVTLTASTAFVFSFLFSYFRVWLYCRSSSCCKHATEKNCSTLRKIFCGSGSYSCRTISERRSLTRQANYTQKDAVQCSTQIKPTQKHTRKRLTGRSNIKIKMTARLQHWKECWMLHLIFLNTNNLSSKPRKCLTRN